MARQFHEHNVRLPLGFWRAVGAVLGWTWREVSAMGEPAMRQSIFCSIRRDRWGVLVLVVTNSMFGLILSGCETLPLLGKKEPIRTHYTLKVGEPMPAHDPLPERTDIGITWFYSDGSEKGQEGFRGYDFDGDRRFNMVEVLAEDGKVQSRVYDFDGDGRIDLGPL